MNWPLPDTAQNMGGASSFSYIDVNDVIAFTETDLVNVTAIILAEGAAFIEAYSTSNSLKFDSVHQETDQGSIHQNSVKGFYPKPDAEFLQILMNSRNARFIVIIKLNNDQIRVLGTKTQPLQFSYKESSGQNPGDPSGIEFTFSGSSYHPPKYYLPII